MTIGHLPSSAKESNGQIIDPGFLLWSAIAVHAFTASVSSASSLKLSSSSYQPIIHYQTFKSYCSSLHSRGGIGQHRVQCIECRLAAHRIDLFEIGLPKAVLTSTTRCKLSQAQSLTCVSGWADAGDFSITDKDALASVLANVHVPLVVHTAQVVPSVAWRSSWSVELAS